MREESFYQISLTCIPGIGSQTIKQLLSYCGSAKQVFTGPFGKLKKIPGIGIKTIELLKQTKYFESAEKKLRLLENEGVKITFYNDDSFPKRLRHCIDSPVILLHKGVADYNSERILSVVGTRNASEYGKIVTNQIINELKKYDAVIVSGLAYGIDIAAHKAALREGLVTWAVIAGGHNKIYPGSHTKVCHEIMNSGCVISEYLPDDIPEATNFPERNRIIAGISDATLVIEAKETGGALITADIADSYDKEVFATPGPVGSHTSAGCHNLVKNNKAHLVTSADDMAKLLGWDQLESTKPQLVKSDFSENEFSIISLLQEKEMHIDELSWKSCIPLSSLANLLLNLEIQGIIKGLPGKKFKFIYSGK
ncbi:MAG TPA: DNA-processing protein DprA [Cyclobacteriaceae bacterium]|jgi:DNA processing protein